METQRTERIKERERLFQEIKDLKGVREELRLQAHLFKAELKDAFEAIEKRWLELEAKMTVLRARANVTEELMDGVRAVIDEIKDQYGRFKRPSARMD